METCNNFRWVRRVGTPGENKLTSYANFGSSATLIGHKIWIIGVRNAGSPIYTLNVNTQEWESVPVDGLRSRSVFNTAALYKDKMYILNMSTDLTTAYQDLWVFDPLLNEARIEPTIGVDGVLPPRGIHFTADLCEKLSLIALFGGSPIQDDQLWILDLTSLQWTYPQTAGEVPGQKVKHASSLVGSRLYIYSGGSLTSPRYDFYMIELARRSQLFWHKLDLQGLKRLGTRGSAMVYVGSGRMIIFGGYNGTKNVDDLLVIDNALSPQPLCREVTKSSHHRFALVRTWGPRLTQSGSGPTPRESTRMLYSNNKVYLMCGSENDRWGYYELSAR